MLWAGLEIQPHLRRHARRQEAVLEVLVLVDLRYRETESTLVLCEWDAEARQRPVQEAMRFLRAPAQYLQRLLPFGDYGFRFECSLGKNRLRHFFPLAGVDPGLFDLARFRQVGE